jgi:hypothetical protein
MAPKTSIYLMEEEESVLKMEVTLRESLFME